MSLRKSFLATLILTSTTFVACDSQDEQDVNGDKADVFGNGLYGDDCSADWHCSDDEGMVCSDDNICHNEMLAEDPWIFAKDVHLENVRFNEQTAIPDTYTRAEGIAPITLSGPEWWQRWAGGATQSFAYSEGTDFGKRCGQASAIRLQAILEYVDAEGNTPGRATFDRLLAEGSGWSGTFYNWTEDLSESEEGRRGSFNSGSMWAWRSSAIKWVNIVRRDGSCDLPTLELVQKFADGCMSSDGGVMQGCRQAND